MRCMCSAYLTCALCEGNRDKRLRAEGRREMLWLTAIGAACDEALEGCSDGMSTVLGIAYGNVSTQAIRALADLGDDNARRMLGGVE